MQDKIERQNWRSKHFATKKSSGWKVEGRMADGGAKCRK